MLKKLLTLDDLVKFCKNNKLTTFNAKEYGQQLCVQIPAKFEVEDSEESPTLFCNVTMFHTGRNRNGSNVIEEAALNCLTTIPYKPLLADIQEIEGTDGEFDFTSHSMEINEDGSINYIEHQVGCFTTDDIYLDEEPDEKGRKYVHAKAAIPREYTKAAEIIERKNGTKVSVELAINSMSYDAKEKELLLTDIEVLGCTLLGRNPKTGREIQEGMESARLDISDFSINNNSISSQDKIIEVIQELKDALDNYTASFAEKNFIRKEDKVELNKELFEQLLAKYNKTEADITFDYSELDDDALSAAFAKAFEEKEDSSSEGDNIDNSDNDEQKIDAENSEVKFDGESSESGNEASEETGNENNEENGETGNNSVTESSTTETNESIENTETESEVNENIGNDNSGNNDTPTTPVTPVVTVVGDDDQEVNHDDGSDAEYLKKIQNNEIQYSATFAGQTKTFAKSLNEIISALTELVNATYGESDNAWYSCEVYEDKTVRFDDWWMDKHYIQKYTVKDNEYKLKGERTEVFARYLTQEEIDALEGLKSKFEEVSDKLSKFEAEPEKIAILESEDYKSIAESKEFIAFKAQEAHFDLSIEEVRAKADQILLNAAKTGKVEFSKNEENITKPKIGFKMFPINTTKKGTKKYGNLLQDI